MITKGSSDIPLERKYMCGTSIIINGIIHKPIIFNKQIIIKHINKRL